MQPSTTSGRAHASYMTYLYDSYLSNQPETSSQGVRYLQLRLLPGDGCVHVRALQHLQARPAASHLESAVRLEG